MRKLLLALLVLMFSPVMGAQAPPSHPILIPIKMQECAERQAWVRCYFFTILHRIGLNK